MTTIPHALALIFAAISFSFQIVDTAEASAERLLIDGSSTVYPLSEAVVEEYQNASKTRTRIGVGLSGTGGGFKKFCKGEIDISGASRPIKKTEVAACKAAKIDFIELPIAYDGIAIVVNKKNTWAQNLSVQELKKIWSPESEGIVTSWAQVRKGFPDVPLKLYGPGSDSGTFDYFTKAINGKERVSRPDYTASEDDNVLVTGVAGDKGAIGYFGLAYYEANTSKIKGLSVDNGNGPIHPSSETVKSGSYAPLSRPIFIYASMHSLKNKPELSKFTDFYITKAGLLAPMVGYVSLGDEIYASVLERFKERTIGTISEDKKSKTSLSLQNVIK